MLKKILVGALAVLLVCTMSFGAQTNQAMAKKSHHEKKKSSYENSSRSLDFDQDWKFSLVNTEDVTDPTGEYENAQEVNYDDSSWRTLDLPHDWSIELAPTADPPAEAGTGFFKGGLGWYRKTFTLDPSMNGKNISIDFDGVYMNSDVYINGEHLGNHPYGYTGFSYDITPYVHTDGKTPNVIAVKVQNKLPTSRWYSGSGIYRNVHLTVTNDTHVNRWGTFVTTPDLKETIKENYANIHVKTDLINENGKRENVTLVSRVKDAKGKVVAKATANEAFESEKTYENDLKVEDPTLWSTDNPYLYTLETEVVVNKKVVDSYETTFGIRYFDLDADEGFSLNGEYMKFHGVNMHHDLGALGAATNYDAVYRQLKIMKSMGVNAVRTSHNPPSPEVIKASDELGLVMIVEAFDAWSWGKRTYDYHLYFDEHSDRDIKEMVNAAKNSPAVIMWSIGNEIPISTNQAGVPIAQRLIDDIESIDTTRPITIGSDKYRRLPGDGSAQDKIAQKVDSLGLNYNSATSIDQLHAKYPDLVLYESESSSETSTRGEYRDPNSLNTPVDYTPGHMATSSYDNNLASWTFSGEYSLKKDRDRKYFAGQFLWSGFDYLGEPTPYWDNYPVKSSFFGAVDTAGFPKDAYYLYQSQWTDEPMVHLVPMDYTNYEPGENVSVWAYSNVDTVELFLNGKSLGEKKFDTKTTADGREYLETTEPTGDDKNMPGGNYTSPNGSTGKLHLTWDVPFEPGELVAVAKKEGKEVARDEVNTAGEAYELQVTPDKKVITADGKSLSFITIDVVDSKGVVVPDADNLINFEVSGGKLVGVDNGRQESAESYKASSREAFNGKALAIIQSEEEEGPISITATSSGLLPGTATVFATDRTKKKDQLVGIEPLHVRVQNGDTPELPTMVEGVYADNTQKELPVRWNKIHKFDKNKNGVYTAKGHVKGTGIKAEAIVTVYDVAEVTTYTADVPKGTKPSLPGKVQVRYTDGVDQFKPVTWDTIDSSAYEKEGKFSVEGKAEGISTKALAKLHVTSDFIQDANLALLNEQLGAKATASFSGSESTVPAAMLDGDTSTGWSNQYHVSATANLPAMSGARESDWVEVYWPEVQYTNNLNILFKEADKNSVPASIEVSYWDGSNYVPVSNLKVQKAQASNEATTISFDKIGTTRIKVDMTSSTPGESDGNFTITELKVIGPKGT
ncbi:glycoside hydrolase family 2 TIM barrel-domain containing protein [Pseudalkalibacillus caeni]|uniref:DUF4982 domain-containing protein n=1 Tax=Exobacillus caeni TaxID=2574798 RepID=A0A5R9F8P4_9BACL|nr:glycoside hydrolase family 2 TIM barrel-domain containing protein [Pseudalkalibacillus caeni]TLS38620.1 DUF4982 domain-containing protein [Pseudalkalibacillus caeni]